MFMCRGHVIFILQHVTYKATTSLISSHLVLACSGDLQYRDVWAEKLTRWERATMASLDGSLKSRSRRSRNKFPALV